MVHLQIRNPDALPRTRCPAPETPGAELWASPRRSATRPGSTVDEGGRYPSGADGVVAAVDVDDLARRRREPVGEQRNDGLRRRTRVADVPSERRPLVPHRLELLEAGNRPRRQRAQ